MIHCELYLDGNYRGFMTLTRREFELLNLKLELRREKTAPRQPSRVGENRLNRRGQGTTGG